jgi:hypothetical protein
MIHQDEEDDGDDEDEIDLSDYPVNSCNNATKVQSN